MWSGGVAPVTRMGTWAVGLVGAVALLVAALLTVIPEDSTGSIVGTLVLLALVVTAGATLIVAIVQRSERGLSVLVAAAALVASLLFVLLHSLFISD